MLKWILLYAACAVISWLILMELAWYAIVKVGGVSKERFLKAISEPDSMIFLKWILYIIIWPIEFTTGAIALILSIKAMKELNKCDEEQA